MQQQAEADNAETVTWSWYTLGWCWLRWERLNEARPWLTDAQARWTLHGNQPAELHCRRALLMVLALGGAGQSLQADWSLLIDDEESAGHLLDAARTCTQQIEHLNLLVQPQTARRLAEQITSTIQAQGTPADQAFLLRAQASITSDLGNQEQALALITQAEHLFAAAGSPLEVARCQHKRAWFFQRLEQYAQALDDLRRAEETFEQLDLPIQRALCRRNLAIIACYRGEYAQALVETYQAREALDMLGRRDAVADCDLTLGNVGYYIGQHDMALAWYQQAQAVYTDLGSRYLALLSERNQALVLRASGDPQQAFCLLATLDAPVRALGDASEHAEIGLAQGLTLMDLADYGNALDYLTRAQAQFADLENQRGVARSLLEQGHVHLAQQHPQQAEACFHAARPILADRPIHIWRIVYGLGRCAQMQGNPAAAQSYYQEASTIIARLRRTLASEHASSGLFAQAQQLFTDALALAAEQGDLALVVSLAEQQRALALQRQIARVAFHLPPDMQVRYDQQSERLRHVIAHDASAHDRDTVLADYMHVLLHTRHSASHTPALPEEPPDLSHLRALFTTAYPAGWVVLLYARCDNQLFIITIDADTLSLEQTACDDSLSALIERARLRTYNEYVYRDFARLHNPDAPPWHVPTTLAERLIPGALRSRLHPDLRLLIVPADPLHALPWAALRVGDSWLCEQATIHLLPALALWEPLMARAVPGSDALLIGCSQFGARAPDLHNMDAEQDMVARLWTGTSTRLTNAHATRHRVLDMAARGDMQRYGLLHITSHARLVAARGLLAHVKLWDTDMLLDEIAGLNLAGALVVLAACDGAASEALPGDEVLSLGHALLAGGARDVIASIWAVFDLAAYELLELLYTELARGHDAPTALARAQRTFINRYAHLGDHRPVEYSPVVWGGLLASGSGTLRG
jgi:tetratricopeptide (TPR) repeat protein